MNCWRGSPVPFLSGPGCIPKRRERVKNFLGGHVFPLRVPSESKRLTVTFSRLTTYLYLLSLLKPHYTDSKGIKKYQSARIKRLGEQQQWVSYFYYFNTFWVAGSSSRWDERDLTDVEVRWQGDLTVRNPISAMNFQCDLGKLHSSF